jgi:hypothetical protein
MVGMHPMGQFCDTGTPIADEQGTLVAMGAARPPGDGTFLTRFIDVRALRATLQDWRKEEEKNPSSNPFTLSPSPR